MMRSQHTLLCETAQIFGKYGVERQAAAKYDEFASCDLTPIGQKKRRESTPP